MAYMPTCGDSMLPVIAQTISPLDSLITLRTPQMATVLSRQLFQDAVPATELRQGGYMGRGQHRMPRRSKRQKGWSSGRKKEDSAAARTGLPGADRTKRDVVMGTQGDKIQGVKCLGRGVTVKWQTLTWHDSPGE